MASDILIVDDEEDIRELVAGILCRRRSRDAHRLRRDSALAAIADRVPRLVFLDIWLQGSRLDGLALLDEIKTMHPDLPVVMISGHGNIETAVSAIRRGAYDFIEKPFKADRLILIAERALETSKLRREVSDLKKRSGETFDLIGTSAGDEPAPPDDRARRADQQPHHDHRPVRLRQGAGRARHPRAVGAQERAVRRRSTPPRSRPSAWRSSCSAPKRTAPSARSARSRRRIAASSISTKSPTCRARRRPRSCACWSTSSSSGSAAPSASRSTCASSPRPRTTSRA